MWEVLFQEYEMIGGENLPPVPDYGDPEYPPYDVPTTEAEFVTEVAELLTGTGASLDTPDLELVMSQDWETFLAGLLGFVDGAQQSGGGQNSNYDDRYANTSPLGEFFIRDFQWLPSVQRLPGYHYYDYLTQDIDPEYLEFAYVAHQGASIFADAGVTLAEIEGMPFQMVLEGRAITVIWHSGLAPAPNLQPVPNDPDAIVVTATLGYFTVQAPPPGPSTGGGTGGGGDPGSLSPEYLDCEKDNTALALGIDIASRGKSIEYGALIYVDAAGDVKGGAIAFGTPDGVSPTVPNSVGIVNIIGMIHSHSERASTGNAVVDEVLRIADRYPSPYDWAEFRALAWEITLAGGNPDQLSLYIVDPFGFTREFSYSDRAIYDVPLAQLLQEPGQLPLPPLPPVMILVPPCGG